MRLWRNQLGQDVVEFALIAGCLALSVGAVVPAAATSIRSVFSRVISATGAAGSSTDGTRQSL